MSVITSMADYYRRQAIYCRVQATEETDPKLINQWLAGATKNTNEAARLSGETRPCDSEAT